MELVVEHHEELELDLAERGVDLLDLWRGKLSFRRLELLIRDLARKPAESRLWAALDPDAAEADSWGTQEYLQALYIDMFGKVSFEKWEPIERPHQRVEKRRRADDLSRALLEQRERQRERELARNRAATQTPQ